MVPSISGGQMKRIVRAGLAILPSRISLPNARATSKDGHAAARVIVRAGPLVIEMATESDLFSAQTWVGAGDGSSDHIIKTGMLSGSHGRMKSNLLSARPSTSKSTTARLPSKSPDGDSISTSLQIEPRISNCRCARKA